MKRTFIILLFLLTGMQQGIFAQCCSYTYQQQVEPPTSAATFGVALGDFDGDGDNDAVAISAYAGIDIYFNNGTGTFTLNAQYAVGADDDFYGVHVCNIDGDTDLDIIAIPFYTSTNLTFLTNNGSGVFTVTSVSSNIATYDAAVGDIDGDLDIDVFLPNSGGGSGKVFKNNGSGTFSLFQTLAGARGHDAELADLDGDGDLDAFVVENSSYGNTVFLNNGTGTFTQSGSAFGSNGSDVGLGDLDSDGDIDAWVGLMGANHEIYANNGSANFTLDTTFAITIWGYCKEVNFYDDDGDGDLDAFLGYYSEDPQVLSNQGNMKFTLCYQAPVGGGSHGQAIGFINNDTYIDIYSGLFSNDDGDYVFLNAGTVTAAIEYKNTPYCTYLTGPQAVTLAGTTGGTFTSTPSGLSLNPTTGDITPSTSTPGIYTVTYTVSGCTVSTQVEIRAIDMTTTLAGPQLTANQGSATYQWLDCNNGFLPILGETAQSFTATSTGDYAAIVTFNGCSDTTQCINVVVTGISKAADPEGVKVFPNPGNGIFEIDIDASLIGKAFSICDLVGRVLLRGTLVEMHTRVDLSKYPSGLYLLKISEKMQGSIKLIKQ